MGAHDADAPLLDPSEYFLVVLEVRIGRFQQGWQETISSLEMRINEYVRAFAAAVITFNLLTKHVADLAVGAR